MSETPQEGGGKPRPAGQLHHPRTQWLTTGQVDFGNVCLGGADVTVNDIAEFTVAGLAMRIDEVSVPGILTNEPALPQENTTGSFGSLLPGTYRVTVFLPDGVFTADPDVQVIDGRWAIVKTIPSPSAATR